MAAPRHHLLHPVPVLTGMLGGDGTHQALVRPGVVIWPFQAEFGGENSDGPCVCLDSLMVTAGSRRVVVESTTVPLG